MSTHPFPHRASGGSASSTASAAGSPVHHLLARLDGVRRSGTGWSARCPAHADRTASLSVAEGDDGRALVHCFAGCDVTAVIAAAGLTLSDMFQRRITHASTPAERAAAAERARQARIGAALAALAAESAVIEIAAHEISAGRALSPADTARVALAAERIAEARNVLWPARRGFAELARGITGREAA